MDYLLRDAYFTGVNYGMFDLERILRVLRPSKGHIVVKESGMHAVEDYLMSRYQMYWQVYFHPVTRSAEILLFNIFRRARELYGKGYSFGFLIEPMRQLFKRDLSVSDYLKLDEAFMQMLFMQWSEERDAILSDLCNRFLNRRLFKYMSSEEADEACLQTLQERMNTLGLDPGYYLERNDPQGQPYDVYSPGQAEVKLPILLLDAKDQLSEISVKSEIIRSINGIHKGDRLVFFPEEAL
jgi:HD superfamily phosphohydrolase